MTVIASYSFKGGVGKTSAAVNLAHLAARDDGPVLLCDFDPQGAASYLFRVKPKVKGGARDLVRNDPDLAASIKGTDIDNLDLLPADFSYRNLDLLLDDAKHPTRRLRRSVTSLADDYEHVFLDCPPGLSLASENVFRAAEVLLVPLIPNPLSVRTFDRLTRFVHDDAPKLRVLAFFSMVDGRKRLHREIVEQVSGRWPGVLAQSIPAASDVERMTVMRQPLAVFAPRSRAAGAFEALWDEVRDRLSG